ncbi:HpcH/HpaI aldolase/citrate lyase family protein [Methylobacterium pseudosasicola]|uniref:Citrate lyase subunit beta / citryl-CoA lyase n=1 Tax=Methylobacterium pseudosasicola TaxID=582667 RepID=A0A1I4UDZ6_9HYPH|nr:CoA ester lyase [Methylobacterium pseudosasicola]SFM87217.1 citrate lyase subunit beta / citryl-CoA lyase [Methylobacterium pseudosasicola]
MNWTEIGTFLFIPVDAERMVAGAHKRGAAAIILDLEDAIAPSNRDAARGKLAGSVASLAEQGLTTVVRVNNDPGRLVDDIRAAAIAGVHAIILPKVEGAGLCQFVDGALAVAERAAGLPERSIGIIAVIEHPAAMRALDEIAAATPRVVALGFGSEDYASAIGTRATFESMAMPAQAVAIAARGRGLAVFGVPGSVGIIDDEPAFKALARAANAFGYTGILCIHPRQVAMADEALAPSADEVAKARRIVEAFDRSVASGSGAVAVDGQMIDIPVAMQAKRVLSLADRLGARKPQPAA